MSIVKQQRESLTKRVDALHESIRRHGDPGRLAEFSQYFTPPEIARFMASLLRAERDEVRLLDAGAGVGMLTAAAVAELVTRQRGPKRIEAVLYEADSRLAEPLAQTLAWCGKRCSEAHISFTSRVLNEDFIAAGVTTLQGAMFETKRQAFDAAILNPPYRNIRSDGDTRRLLRLVGIETTNLYSAFVWLAMLLLGNGGEISAITPRSFCNGPYFRNFRRDLLRRTRLTRLHVFEARDRAFSNDEVLQENVIFHAIKGQTERGTVTISSSAAPGEHMTVREAAYEEVIRPCDKDCFIHIPGGGRTAAPGQLRRTLDDLGVSVSTGRVVDFRAAEFLRDSPESGTLPLIYPCHMEGGAVIWPRSRGKKPCALVANEATRALFVPSGWYVVTRRFSAKEEPRRIVAAVYDPTRVDAPSIAFENHLNYYHTMGAGCPRSWRRAWRFFSMQHASTRSSGSSTGTRRSMPRTCASSATCRWSAWSGSAVSRTASRCRRKG